MDVPSRYTPSYSAFALHEHVACVAALFAVHKGEAGQWMCPIGIHPPTVHLPCTNVLHVHNRYRSRCMQATSIELSVDAPCSCTHRHQLPVWATLD